MMTMTTIKMFLLANPHHKAKTIDSPSKGDDDDDDDKPPSKGDDGDDDGKIPAKGCSRRPP